MALSAQAAQAQNGTWTEQPALLSEWYVAYAGPGTYYTRDIPLRPGQQQLRFTTANNPWGACFINMRVRVTSPYSGPWQTLYNDQDHCLFGNVRWPGVPVSQGVYKIELEWTGASGSAHTLTYDLLTAPNANRAFSDSDGNEMLLWSGGRTPRSISRSCCSKASTPSTPSAPRFTTS